MTKIIKINECAERLNLTVTELQRLAGFKEWSQELGKYGLVKGTVEKNTRKCDTNCIYEEDLEKILIFQIYKNSYKSIVKTNNIKIVKQFEDKWEKLGGGKILNEISHRFKDIINYFDKFRDTLDLEGKYVIGEKIMLLMAGENHIIKKDILEIYDKQYIAIKQYGERKSLKLTPNYIQDEIIKKYENIFNEYFEREIPNSFSCYNIQSQMDRLSSDYNVDKKIYDTKLLKPHKSYFLSLENKILETTGNDLKDENKMSIIKDEFIKESQHLFYEKLEVMKNIIENIEFKSLYEGLNSIYQKRQNYTDQQRKFAETQSYGHNFFSTFIQIDDALDFYNSKDGKLLNEYFKIHNFLEEMIKYFNHSIGKRSNDNSMVSIRNHFTKKMTPLLKCLGYDYYFNYHLLHDAYEILKSNDLMKNTGLNEEKIINIISQILSHGSFYVNSRYGGQTLLKKAIGTNNPKAVEVLRGHIENVDKEELLSVCFDYVDTSEMIIPTIECINDIDKKAFYKALYEGDYKYLDFLYEHGKVFLLKDTNSIEVYFCVKGANSERTFEVILKHLEKNYDNKKVEILKNNFLEIAALWGNKPILYSNLSYLKDLPVDLLNKVLIYCLGQNVIDIFKELYSSKVFDPNSILFKFLIEGNLIMSEVEKETWEFMFNEPFMNVDVNKKIDGLSNPRYDHENTIAGRAKERLHFSIKNKVFLEKLLNESEIFIDAFQSVLESLNKNSLESYICYMGFPSNEEIHPSLKQYQF